MTGDMRIYGELADWWHVFSPPSHYVEEARHLLTLLRPQASHQLELLELGSGGGSLVSHFSDQFSLTLSDVSAAMLAVNRRVNPQAHFVQGDMRTLDLGKLYDRVLLHDAVMYATTAEDLRATLATARRHVRAGGRVVVVPDYVAETYRPGSSCGGEDSAEGRSMRYLEWHWDPDPSDTHYDVAFAFLLRGQGGEVRSEHEMHRFGLFPRAVWLQLFDDTGFTVEVVRDPWDRDIFVAEPTQV